MSGFGAGWRRRTTDLVRRGPALACDQTGSAGLEFAAVAPVLILACLATVDIGFGTYRSTQVENAARAGAEYARLHGFDAAGISNAVAQTTSGGGITAYPAPTQYCGCASSSGIAAADCSVPCPGGSLPGTYVTVSAQATYNTLVPYPLVATSYQLSGVSTIRIQ